MMKGVSRPLWSRIWSCERQNPLPVPYPGMYPTRWAAYVYVHDNPIRPKLVWKYVGKPSPWVWDKIAVAHQGPVGSINFYEYDLGGVVRSLAGNVPRLAGDFLRYGHYDEVCCRFYYPWDIWDSFIATWNRQPFRKRLVMGKHAATSYSTTEKLFVPAFYETLKGHKRWLQNGIWK